MADTKITALTALTAADPANDVIPIVDVSDTTMAASGTTKKISVNNILGASGTATLASAAITGAATVGTTLGVTGVSTLASAVVTGDLTVDTSTLKVDSTNNRVGILTASPRSPFALDVLGNVALGDSTTTTGLRLKLDCLGTAGNVAIMSFATAGTNKAFFGLSGGYLGDASTDAIVATDAAGAGIRFFVADTGVEVARFNSTGNLAFANGKGIDFSAVTGGTGTATANVLNDYEEGTWTATLNGTVADPTIPVTTTGRYTKIGRVVSISAFFSSVITTGASGRIQITGLPFTNNSSIVTVGTAAFNKMATFTGSPFSSLAASSTTIIMFSSNSAADYTAVLFNAGTTQDLWVSLNYTVA
jgi:hypothetical protein